MSSVARVGLLGIVALAAWAQCGPSPELRREIDALPAFDTDTATFQEIIAARRALVVKYPGNLFAENALNWAVSSGWWAEHERQVELARYKAVEDRELGAFLEDGLTGYAARRHPALWQQLMCGSPVSIARLRDTAVREAEIRDARRRLEGRTDNEAMTAWNTLLPYLRSVQDSGLPELVAKLRGLNLYHSEAWIRAVNTGYSLVEDKTGPVQLRAEVAKRRPDSTSAILLAEQDWNATHPPKGTSEAALAERALEEIDFRRQLCRQHPNSIRAAIDYVFGSAYGAAPGLSREQSLSVVEVARTVDRDYPFTARFDELPFRIAQVYLDRNLNLGEVPSLVAEQVRRMRMEYELALHSPQSPESANAQLRRAQFRGQLLLATHAQQTDAAAEARRHVALARADLAALRPGDDATDGERKSFAIEQDRWTKLAAAVGMDPIPIVEPRVVDWASVKRTPMGDFDVTDLSNRRWTLASWKGKVVLVNLWATWCVPCRAELPEIQKLHDGFRALDDRLVITVNIDEDADLARKFVAEHGYTFPVVASRAFASLIDQVTSVPLNRIIDAQGHKLSEDVDLRCKGCSGQMAATMDRIKGEH
jgi:thiol-disulfide isomerase/thioredoxin